MSTITELAQSLTIRAHNEVDAADALAVERLLELVLIGKGFADESEVTDPKIKANVAYTLAYHITLSALDWARSKLKKGVATPAEAEFRDMVKDFEALLKRLASKAGIREDGSIPDTATFIIDKVPFFESD